MARAQRKPYTEYLIEFEGETEEDLMPRPVPAQFVLANKKRKNKADG